MNSPLESLDEDADVRIEKYIHLARYSTSWGTRDLTLNRDLKYLIREIQSDRIQETVSGLSVLDLKTFSNSPKWTHSERRRQTRESLSKLFFQLSEEKELREYDRRFVNSVLTQLNPALKGGVF